MLYNVFIKTNHNSYLEFGVNKSTARGICEAIANNEGTFNCEGTKMDLHYWNKFKIFDNSKMSIINKTTLGIEGEKRRILFPEKEGYEMKLLSEMGNEVTAQFQEPIHTNQMKIISETYIQDAGASPGKIFISHSSKDTKIANAFCELILEQGLNVNLSKDVFSTSLALSKPISGEDFRDRIKRELISAKMVLQFISHNYKASEVCLNEMGAAWVLNATVIPLIIEPESYDVGFIHSTDQQIQLNKKKDILQLISDHETNFTQDKFNHSRLDTKIDDFLKILTEELQFNEIKKVFSGTWQIEYDNGKGFKGRVDKMEIKEGVKIFEYDRHEFDLNHFKCNEKERKLSFTKVGKHDERILKTTLQIKELGKEYVGKETGGVGGNVNVTYKCIS